MEIKQEQKGQCVVLSINGPIMIGESSAKLVDTLKELLSNGVHKVILDFSGVNYIDSTGLGELVGFLDRFQQKRGLLALVNPQDRILYLLKISGLDDVFPIYGSVDEAISAMSDEEEREDS